MMNVFHKGEDRSRRYREIGGQLREVTLDIYW